MSRLSFRPRPLDVHKKLPIVKSIKDFEDYDETPTSASTRNSQILRLAAADADNEGNQIPSKKVAADIPTPQFIVVDTYERDYSCTFTQTTSYLRGRGLRSEVGEFVEYDLDNEDEDWLQLFNDSSTLSYEKFEALLFKLEVMDHKSRERAGIIAPTFGSPISVLLQLDAAMEGLQNQQLNIHVLQSVYNYWKYKRERWRKPILRWLQPPPSVNDTNPFNVFRPREKAHRLHTRRMQRRENSVQSFEKLRQVRRNLDQAKNILETLIKREEKKRDVINNEVTLQRFQMKYKNEFELIQDSLTWPGFGVSPRTSEYEPLEVDEVSNCRSNQWAALPPNQQKQATRHGWLHKIDPREPVLLFTKPLDQVKLAAAGIAPPVSTSASGMRVRFRGRMGRGGRIIFDRWNPMAQAPVGGGSASFGVRRNTQQLFSSLA